MDNYRDSEDYLDSGYLEDWPPGISWKIGSVVWGEKKNQEWLPQFFCPDPGRIELESTNVG